MKTQSLNKVTKIFQKIKWKEALALLMLLLAFVFFRSERREIASLWPQIRAASPLWIFIGVVSSLVYILLQAAMYVYSFRAVGKKISLADATDIFLKRNLLSVFLPAGGVTSLAYLPKNFRKKNIAGSAVHQASSIYGFIGILSVFIVGVPLIIYAVSINRNFGNNLWFLGLIGISLLLFFWLYFSFKNKGAVYKILNRYFPTAIAKTEEIFSAEIDQKYFWLTVLMSVLIEFCGVLQVIIAMYALGAQVSVSAAALAYIISVILMIVSPFLRGLGAVEFSLAFILANFGYSHTQGLSITLFYRLFEFWLPLVGGFVSFFWNGRKLVARLVPAALIFILGIINILSVITPPIASRAKLNQIYFPPELMHYSKMFTLISGILLLFTSAYLLKAYKRAWFVAVALSVFSIVGNLIKAFDYEEAIFAFGVLLLLFYTRKEYSMETKKQSLVRGFSRFAGVFFVVVVLDLLSFYFIPKRHFGIDFTWEQSVYYTMQTFLFFKDNGLKPLTGFARDFLYLNDFLGVASWILLIFSFYKTSRISDQEDAEDFERAKGLLSKYGSSSLDYFKTTEEKKLYFSEQTEGFVSYRHDRNFAVVLDEPVCDVENKEKLAREFEEFCSKKGLRVCYYRTSEEALKYLKKLKKKHLLIGQEGILNAENFKMEGKERKSLRNATNSLLKRGYSTEILLQPQTPEVLDELQKISDEWLKEFDKKEIVFAEGKFDAEILQNQDVIILKDAEGKIKSFMNIIPDFAPDECTYDMIRRTADAPNGAMDLLILKLVEYAKGKNLKFINLGMAPLAGIDSPENPAEEIMNFAYHRVGTFKHYQSLRFFKEKFADSWNNKYLVYGSDADLLQLPVTLSAIMKP